MKIVLAIAAFLLTTVSFAQSKTEKEILSLSKKRVQWLLEGKVDSLAVLYDENSITNVSPALFNSNC